MKKGKRRKPWRESQGCGDCKVRRPPRCGGNVVVGDGEHHGESYRGDSDHDGGGVNAHGCRLYFYLHLQTVCIYSKGEMEKTR